MNTVSTLSLLISAVGETDIYSKQYMPETVAYARGGGVGGSTPSSLIDD